MKQMTFNSLCKKLKRKSSFNCNAEDLNTLIGAVESLIGDSAEGSVTAFIKALAEKDKVISLGKSVLDAILSQLPVDYSGRVNQMKEAYGTIFFTSFFDELDQQLPDNIRRSIQLSLKEKQSLFHTTISTGARNLDSQEIVFPDIVYGYTAVDKHLETMYRSMSDKLQNFVKALSFQDTAEEKDIFFFNKVIKELPTAAVKRFHDQYLVLCSKFNEFYIFAQIEQETEREIKYEDRYHTILSTAMHAQEFTEAGLANLEKIILELPTQIKEEKVQEIVKELVDTYRDSINHPLIETKDEEEKLTYPLISQAFIPQAYKLLKYFGDEHLEQPETWKNLTTEQDMMSFWAKYCLDIGSVDDILLILGEPGGGKSLLTKILCARMISPSNIVIRIPLRQHNMEDEIESIVCRQIEKDGDSSEPIPTFKWFAEHFQGNPITLLFDGYDEVMQATGGVYRNLLTKIHQFQYRCQEQNRPVRVVVTSRETLIDKADIPKKTTVMKLLEFDETRKKQWINIWNEKNHNALTADGIEDFSLPEENKDIEDLSGQPLLLLMLAIYDANFETKTNALKQRNSQAESLDRTKLYDELLRRFIRRELRKGPKGQGPSFDEVDYSDQSAMVDEEMKKLGIAALGMFVREKLSLKVQELEDDMVYMKAELIEYDNKNKKTLKNAEAVFGSFFFIHDSKTENREDETEVAFEFLHKTFYEFLVADLILQYLINTVDKLNEQRASGRWGKTNYSAALDNPSPHDNAYYAVLNSACLCTEPEIIQMIAEWKNSKLDQYFHGDCSNFGEVMDQVMTDLLNRHATLIRTGVFMPFTEKKGGLAGGRLYLQACAVYLMNLIILKILTSGQCRLKFEEWSYISQFLKLNVPLSKKEKPEESLGEKFTRKLKINPSEEMILKFMALFQIHREADEVVLVKRTKARKFERENLQEARMDVFDFVQDDVTWKVYQLHDANNPMDKKQKYRHDLHEQGFDLDFEMSVAQLHKVVLSPNSLDFLELRDVIQNGVKHLYQDYSDVSVVLDWLLCIRLLVDKLSWLEQPRNRKYDDLYPWKELADIIFHQYISESGIILTFLEIIKKLDYGEIVTDTRFMEDFLLQVNPASSDVIVALTEVIQQNLPNVRRRLTSHEIDPYRNQMIWERVQLYTDTPKTSAAILKLLYMTGEGSPSDTFLMEIQERWNQYLWISPEELPELLQTYVQMGKLDEVKEFLQYVERNQISILSQQALGALDEFLSVAQTVREDQNFSECIAHHIERDAMIEETLTRCPRLFIRLMRHIISSRRTQSIIIWEELFFRKYDELFHSDPEEAVSLLLLIFSKKVSPENKNWLSRACMYSLKYYRLLLETSVNTAALLLTLFEKINRLNNLEDIHEFEISEINMDRYELIAFYVMLCINRALYIRDVADIPPLTALLNSMDSSTKAYLEKYFEEKFPYLRAYSRQLAAEVTRIYGIS